MLPYLLFGRAVKEKFFTGAVQVVSISPKVKILGNLLKQFPKLFQLRGVSRDHTPILLASNMSTEIAPQGCPGEQINTQFDIYYLREYIKSKPFRRYRCQKV
jgi:hypothetical protein